MAILVIEKAEKEAQKGRTFEVHDDAVPTVIGRDAANDIHLQDERASRVHCRIFRRHGAWRIEDLDSRNGILHRGQVVRALELTDEDRFQVGSTLLRFAAGPVHDPYRGGEVFGCKFEELQASEAGILRYRARQLAMDRQVRVDLVHPRRPCFIPADPRCKRWIERARAAAGAAEKLNHPRLAQLIHCSIPDAEGGGFAVMRLPAAGNLEARLAEALAAPLPRRLRLLHRLAEALLARGADPALRSPIGLAHIGIDDSLEPWIPPLEAAALLAELRGAAPHLPALIPYLPPEAIAPPGEQEGEPLPLASVFYNLGAIGYHLVTRKPPMGEGGGEAVIENHRRLAAAPADLLEPETPAEVAALLARMLAKTPGERPASPAEILDVLGRAAGTGAVAADAGAAAMEPARRERPQPRTAPAPAAAKTPRPPRPSAARPPTPARRPLSRLLWLPLWILFWAALFIGVRKGVAMLMPAIERYFAN